MILMMRSFTIIYIMRTIKIDLRFLQSQGIQTVRRKLLFTLYSYTYYSYYSSSNES